MTTQTEITRRYLEASHELLQCGLAQMKTNNPDGYAEVTIAASRGAFFELRTALSVAGLVETSINLVMPDGEHVEILGLEMEFRKLQ